MNPWIQTYSGNKFYYLKPKKEHINFIDIASSLSNMCRYLGHINGFYSVATHSVALSHAVDSEYAREALMHDAAEAYVGDMPYPLKLLFPEFKELEESILEVIFDKYGLQYPVPKQVKEYDYRIILNERASFLTNSGYSWDIDRTEMKPVTLDYELDYGEAYLAKQSFLTRAKELGLYQGLTS